MSQILAGANYCAVVTTSDTVDLPIYTQKQQLTTWLYIGGTGNLVAVLENGATCLFSTIPAGTFLPIAVKRVNATSTTATTIVAGYHL